MKEKQRGDDHKLYCPTCKAGRNCMDHLMIRENDLQEQVTQLKADLATAKQGLEHYADENSWDYSRFIHDGMDDAQIAALPKDLYIWDDANGQDLAQQTLDKIGKE
jgi:6-phosphogluconate dehydrogenase (decarboxylating)